LSSSLYGQQASDTLTIPEQFDKIYRTSSSYQEYKVIGKTRFQKLKQDVSDSLNQLQNEIQSKDQLISSQKDSIQNIKQIAETFEGDYRQMLAQKNSIHFLGIEFLKSTYNTIVWSLIGFLTILLLYFIYRFKNSNVITSKAKTELQDVEEEFAIHKKKSLEREQKLRRQLQDEINKQRGV
jgi:preprotein translocase subunit SecF